MRMPIRFGLFSACALVMPPLPALAAPLPAQAWSDRLAKLDDLRRGAAIRAAINDSDHKCARVVRNQMIGPYKNLIMWSARCEPMKDFALFLGPDGSVQIRPCADLAGLKLPLCRPFR